MARRKSRKKPITHRAIFICMMLSTFILTVVSGFIIHNILFEKSEQTKPNTPSQETASINKAYENTAEQSDALDRKPVEKSAQEKKDKIPVHFYTEEVSVPEKVNAMVANMTLEDKVGQMMVVGFQNDYLDGHIKTMIEDFHVGGIILYDRNMKNPKQVAKLNNDLQELSKGNQQKIPLYISIDQEGGNIVRMEDQVTHIPSQKVLGESGSSELVYNTALKTAKELMAMGIQVNFAPVLDLSDTDSRSFGKSPQLTAGFGKQAVSGLTEAGMTATLKHFPGNGRSNVDPHLDTSSVRADKMDLENGDIYPFKDIIKNEDNNNFFVMVTHIKYPAYDEENPASISSVIIQDLLRQKLGYQGLVVTDDLEMGAVNKYFSYEDLGYKAVEAGNDLLLVCHTLENQRKVYNGILDAVKSGKISERIIDEAVTRILTHKLLSLEKVTVNPDAASKEVGN
ncbi:glycoside hydrolase family 3 N-terminal domain-containing protein [Metabacillus indicus]|uniref:glycoside hydrolase family 3 N-terminal domain-containing protein n=1 Tax=Metabacillus indicus TaxID=246786 RepID=UPI003174145D